MKKIWAPWRMEYIQQSKDDECFICNAISDESINDKKNYLLYRGKKSFVFLNKYPYISGHLMIAPNIHTSELNSIPEDTSSEMWQHVSKSIDLLRKSINPDGFNIGINLGKVAGAGLETHLHIHIVPRWSGDTNFMPILSDTRVISQALEETFEVLKRISDKIFE